MTIVMTLLVRDESDVIAATLEHHLAAGVDHVIVTDNGSVDCTVELLQQYQDTGRVTLRREHATDYQQDAWVTRMARQAFLQHGADWVINADADEFLWPLLPGGLPVHSPALTLREVLATVPRTAGSIAVRRDNLLARPGATGSWARTHTLRDTLSLSERGTRIGPKSVHRGDPHVSVAFGNHTVDGPRLGPSSEVRPLLMFHLPDRSYAQFARKIANGGASVATNPRLAPEISWHWRRDHERLQQGTLELEWESRQPDEQDVTIGFATGTLVPELRLLRRLEYLRDRTVIPGVLDDLFTPTAVTTSD